VDEQFACFVEMIEKIHVSVPLKDVLHVPSYAKYIKDIINNKRPLPSMKVVKLTEECSAAILDFPKNKKDPRCLLVLLSLTLVLVATYKLPAPLSYLYQVVIPSVEAKSVCRHYLALLLSSYLIISCG
jgi:hypothetical protein